MRPKIEEFGTTIERLYPEDKRLVRSVTIQVTDGCNLRCTYCYQIAKQNHIISFDTAKGYLTKLLNGDNPYINQENTSGMVLEFIGGEPFLAIDVIQEITDWVVEYMTSIHHPWLSRFRISICSNGTLYFNPKVQKFLQKYNNLTSFTVSLDGNKMLHDKCRIFPNGNGSYDLAVAAVTHYCDTYNSGIMPSTKLTLAPANIEYLFEAHTNLIENLGYTQIHSNCCFEEGWELKHATIMYQQMMQLTDWLFDHHLENKTYISLYETTMGEQDTEDKNWCGGTGDMIAVDWKGDIYPCIRYMESSLDTSRRPLIIGNVTDGIATTDEHKQIISCLKCIKRSTQSTEECMKCPISQGCAWCSGYNYQKFGTVDKRATYICEMHKARVLANLYFWKRWKQRYPDDEEQGIIENHVPRDWAIAIIGEEELNKLNQFLES